MAADEISAIYSAAPQAKGETWNCTINATDATGLASLPNYTTRAISNSNPTMGLVSITPNPANTTDTLTCSAIGYDLDFDALTMNITWYNGSTYFNSSTFATTDSTTKTLNLTAGIQASLEIWNCTVFVNDGTTNSPLNSTTITTSSSAPSINSITIKPATAYKNSTLNCSATYNDADLEKGNITFTWYNGSTLYWQATQFNKMNNEVVQEPLTWVDGTGLLNYWKFSEGNGTEVFNISGGGNNGTLTNFNFNAGDGWREGKYGTGIQFDGINDVITVGNPAPLNSDFTNLTVAAWIYSNGTQASDTALVGKFTTWGFTLHFNTLYFYINNVGNWITTSYSSYHNGWHFITATFNSNNSGNGTMKMYVDGVLKTTIFSKSGSTGSGGTFAIGGQPGGTTYFNGTIDEVMIYNRTLTSGEISAIYNNSPQFKNEVWNCTINATDMQGMAGNPNSTTRTISNSNPTMGLVSITPNPANTTDTLTCSAIGYDLDYDSLTMNITWYNGSTYYNSSTFSTTESTTKTLNLTAGIQA